MMRDYYSLLQVSHKASFGEIRRSYKRLILQYHPDKNKSEGAEEIFKQICDAYETLSNPAKRRAYDVGGESAVRALKISESFRPPSGMAYFPRPSNATDLNYKEQNHLFVNVDRSATCFMHTHGIKLPEVHHDVHVTLDQLKEGCTKRMRVIRQWENPPGSGRCTNTEKIITLTIPPGCPRGTHIYFHDDNDDDNQTNGPQTSGITFTIYDAEHKLFRRQGADLLTKVTIGIKLALMGGEIQVLGICGETWTVNVPNYTESGDKCRIIGAGLPIPSVTNETKRGDIVLLFHVRMPDSSFKSQIITNLAALLPSMLPTQSSPQLSTFL